MTNDIEYFASSLIEEYINCLRLGLDTRHPLWKMAEKFGVFDIVNKTIAKACIWYFEFWRSLSTKIELLKCSVGKIWRRIVFNELSGENKVCGWTKPILLKIKEIYE